MQTGSRRNFLQGWLGSLALLAWLGHAPALWAAACSNVATGNWSAAGTWAAPCNVAGGHTAADTVTIINNRTVTVNGARAASSVTINGGANASRLTFAAGSSLAVTNNVIVNLPTAAVTKSITVLTGTLTVGGNVTLNGGTAATRDALLSVSSGLITINGGLTINASVATSSTASITAAGGRITVNGAAGVTNGDVVSVGAGTFSGTNAGATFNNTSATNVARTTVSTGTLNIAGNLTNAAAETVQLTGAGTITVNGTVTNNGTYTVGTGTVNAGTFTNANVVTVSTGLINVTGNYTNTAVGDTVTISNVAGRLTVGGTLTNGGTVTAATGTVNAGTFTNTNVVTVSSGLINVTGDYTNTAVGDTVTISNVAGRLTVGGTLTNGGTVAAATGTVNAGTFTNTNVVTVSSGLINVTGDYTNTAVGDTVTISGAGGRLTVGGTLTNAGSIIFNTAAGGIVNANGDFVSSGIVTNTTAGILNIGGNATVNGTFTAGAGAVVFNGAAAQTLGSTAARTFNNLTVNKPSNNVSITCGTPSPLVNVTLALTSGRIVTAGTSPGCSTACSAQVPIVVAAAGAIAGGGSTSYVQGALRKLFNAGATLNYRGAGLDEYPVGDASNYTPVEITAGTTSTAGSVTACVTPTDHPQVTTPVATTGIDAAKSVNRYWSLTTSTINTSVALVNAIFKFVAGDVDAGAATGNFIVEDWNGATWSPATLVAANATSTQASNIDLTQATNDFAIGEPFSAIAVPGLGRYNAFETSTPAGSILGVIQTKVAGIGFSVDIVHVNAARTGVQPGVTTVEVRLLDSSGGGALDANGCNAAWPPIQALPNFPIPPSGRGTIPAVTVTNSYPSVAFEIRSPVGGPYTQTGCSTDLFAIRPQSLTITAHDATWATAGTGRPLANIGASGGNVHKASTSGTPLPFTLRATPVPAGATNYNGTPTTVAGFPSCAGLGALCANPGTLSYTAGSWTAAGSGVRENATATYSEAGAFNLQLEDAVYASVDAVDGTPAATRTVPATASAQIGRFVPDHFDVTTLVAPAFRTFNVADAACSAGAAPRRAFTYIGQPFGYLTTPQATVLARNAAGATTANYAGTLWKIGGAAPGVGKDCTTDPNICQFTTSWAAGGNSSNVIESYTYALTPVGTPNWDDVGATPAAASVTAGTGVNAGTGIITYAASDALAFLRSTTTPQATFTANITNTISVRDTSEAAVVGNGTIATTTAAAFGSIAFDSGNEFRYGRLQFLNAHGSVLLALDVPIQVEYWNGTLWLRNAADHCTSFGPANFALGNVTGAISTSTSGGGIVSGGGGRITLTKPTSGTNGTVDVTLNLGATGTANATPCPAWAPVPAATALNAPYLQNQCAGAGAYNRDPSARATFGIYRNKFILLRENY